MDLGYFETSLPVADLAASLAFYEAIGFERTPGADMALKATMLLGDCRLGLFQGALDPPRAQLMFRQGPVEAVVAAADEACVSARIPLHTDADGAAAVVFDDPDGHPLRFIRLRGFSSHTQNEPADRTRSADPTVGWYEMSLPVNDIATSARFYETFGFKIVIHETKGTRISLQNADCRLGLFKGHLEPNRPQLIFWQGDIAAMAERVRNAGIEFHSGPKGDNHHGAFMLSDPDGHPIYFVRIPGVTRGSAI